jgi:tetratricopeptide (TPR) repeat protein
LGVLHWNTVNAGISPDDAPLALAEECSAKALALDPNLPQGHVLAGCLARAKGRLRDQVRHYRRALEIDPNNAEALMFLAIAYAMAGKTHPAAPLATRLLEIDPFMGHSYIPSAAIAAIDGRFDEAVLFHQRAQEIDRSPPPRVMYAIALARAGHVDAAHDVVDALARDVPKGFASQFGIFIQEALRGERARAFAAVTPLVVTAAGRVEYLSWHMGVGYALLGETERATTWLDHAVRWGFISYPFLMSDPLLERIRGEPEFTALAERTKRAWEAFET